MDVFTTGLPNLLTVTPWTIIKSRLENLYLVPLMYYFELIITIFQVNSLKNPSHRHFNVLNFVKIQDSNTRTSDKLSVKHTRSATKFDQQFYFNRIPRLWNKLPLVDLSLSSNTIKQNLFQFLWYHCLSNFQRT